MRSDFYQIVDVPASFASVEETRGGRPKSWVDMDDSGFRWLLKSPRDGTGEHWAEKAASEIGHLLGVKTAHVELARYKGKPATICRSFIPTESVGGDSEALASEWLDGWKVLKLSMPDYDEGAMHQNREHNVKSIAAALEVVAPSEDLGSLAKDLASYALLDGVIGNMDRHHENWMLEMRRGDHAQVRAAPSFDHASSLGRELSDERRRRVMSSEGGVLRYLKRGRGGVYAAGNRRRALAPIRLAQLLCRWNADLGADFAERLNAAPNAGFRAAIDRIPPEFMSDDAKEFAYGIVAASKAELLRSIA